MTQDDIIRMAREAGFGHSNFHNGFQLLAPSTICTNLLTRFAALVAQNYMAKACGGCVIKQCYKRMDAEIEAAVLAEREACAKVCDELQNDAVAKYFDATAGECAAAIRARGEQ